jgi:hypothetical protein
VHKQMLLFDPEVLRGKFLDGLTPGFAAEFDPYEADAAGAFFEHALDEEDALESSGDAFSLELFP